MIAAVVAVAVMVVVVVGAAVLRTAVVLRRKVANTLGEGVEEMEAREMAEGTGAEEFIDWTVLGEVDIMMGGFPAGPPLRGEVEGHLWGNKMGGML